MAPCADELVGGICRGPFGRPARNQGTNPSLTLWRDPTEAPGVGSTAINTVIPNFLRGAADSPHPVTFSLQGSCLPLCTLLDGGVRFLVGSLLRLKSHHLWSSLKTRFWFLGGTQACHGQIHSGFLPLAQETSASGSHHQLLRTSRSSEKQQKLNRFLSEEP